MKKLSLLVVLTFVFSLVTTSYGFIETEVIAKQIKEKNAENRSEVIVKYPQIKHSDMKVAKRFNSKVESMITKKVNGFKKNVTGIESESEGENRPVGYDLTIDFQVEMIGKNFISVSFGESTYLGGAHPNFQSYALNYNLKTGKTFELKDLFKKNANYLKSISAYSIQKITEKQGDRTDWIEKGASPKDENFDSFTISQYGLKFVFDPYQVGAYALGSFEVMMPYESLPVDIQSNWMKEIVADISASTSVSSYPKNVVDYYLAMPTDDFYTQDITGEKYTDPAEIRGFRLKHIGINDTKNGYLKLQGIYEGWAEIALFKRKDGSYLIARAESGCGPSCEGVINFFTYENEKWTDVTSEVFPTLTEKQINKMFNDKKVMTAEYGNYHYFLLPRNGTTVKVACNMCSDGDGTDFTLMEFAWNGEKFTAKK